MANYFTAPDIELAADREYLLQIADDDGNGVADPDVLAWAIDAACSFMDGWLQINPGIPIATITPILKFLGVKIAIYMLASRPPRIVLADVRKDYDDAILRLKEIIDGDYSIAGASPALSARGAIKTNKTEQDSVWYGREFPRRGY